MTSEQKVVDAIHELIEDAGGYTYKVHGDAIHVNEPDIHACLEGRFLAIEVKRPDEEPRPGQLSVLRKWRRAGAVAFWADSVAMARRELVDVGLLEIVD